MIECLNYLTNECVSDNSERIGSIQIDKNFITQTFRIYNFIISGTVMTDDEVVYSKRLGNKVLVDLNRSNPLTVIWDALVGQIIQTYSKLPEPIVYLAQCSSVFEKNWAVQGIFLMYIRLGEW